MNEDTITEINVCHIPSALLWSIVCKANWSSNVEIMALQNAVAQAFTSTTVEHVAGLCTTTHLSKTTVSTSSGSAFDL